jgi:uncharacterized protein YraI
MKHSILIGLASLAAVAVSAPTTAEAQGYDLSRVYRVNATSLNVRTGPSTRYSSVGRLPRGRAVYVHRFQAGWAQITFSGARRWTSARYLTRGSTAPTPTRPTPTRPTPTRPTPSTPGTAVAAATYEVSYSRLNVRTGPSTRNSVVTTLNRGTRVRVTRRSGSWNGFVRSGRTVWAYGPGMRRASTAPPRPTTPAPSTRPVLTGTVVRRPYQLKVRVSNASLRTRPAASATRIRGLIRNQVLTVVRISGNYRGVKGSSAASSPFIGWVHRSLLTYLSRPAPTTPTPAPARDKVRSGSRSKSVGGSNLGATLTRSCDVRHNRNRGAGSESWRLTGKFVGRSSTVASGNLSISAQAGGNTTVTRKKLALLGREFTLSTERLTREYLWIDNKTLWRGSVGPIPLALKVDAGAKAEITLGVSRGSVTLAASTALFGEGRVEFDALLARAGVRATLNLVEVSMPATFSFSRGNARASLDFVIASNVSVGVYAIVGRKVWGVGFEKEYGFDIPFLQFTLREVRVPILSATVTGS